MEIDIDATRHKFVQLGIDLRFFDRLSEREKLLHIERLLQSRRLTPVYSYTNSSSPGLIEERSRTPRGSGRSSDSISARIEREMSVYELRSRYRFDYPRGHVYDRFTYQRVDRLHLFRQYDQHNTRYRQVSLTIRGLAGKLSAHRMIWAAFHNRWPRNGMVIDHINGNTEDNQISNLRESTQQENVRSGMVRRAL